MKITNHPSVPTSKDFEQTYILQCGTFYFYKDFIMSQINEGEYITWENVQEIINIAIGHYGQNKNLSLISNRLNTYDIRFEDWEKFYNEGFQLKALAIVTYNKSGIINFMVEKKSFRQRIRNFYSLNSAIKWVQSLD